MVLAAGLLPAAFSVATGTLAGAVPDAVGQGMGSEPGRRVAVALVAATVVYVVLQVIGPVRAMVADILMRLVDESLALRLMGAVSGPREIAHLEDPVGTCGRSTRPLGSAGWPPSSRTSSSTR